MIFHEINQTRNNHIFLALTESTIRQIITHLQHFVQIIFQDYSNTILQILESLTKHMKFRNRAKQCNVGDILI